MLDSIRHTRFSRLNQAGVTIVELMIVIGISSMLVITFMTVSVYMYGDTLRTSVYSGLASDSQRVLRATVEELRLSSSIRQNNAVPDPSNPGGWTTSNSNLILIISTPALDGSNNFIIDSSTGAPYQNEIVYFVSGGTLYKRILANTGATGNDKRTSCPAASASATCPPDVAMSNNFKSLSFVFYDQDDQVTTSIPAARSIRLTISMERRSYGKLLTFDNTIRITIRNSLS